MVETSKNSPIPITLNCSGGISLGAYMAGVFYELVKVAVKDNPKIVIDIITGASAGAMSGVIAAYYLLKEDASNDFQEAHIKQNIFYRAWVSEIDIKNLDTLMFFPQQDEKTDCQFWSVLSGEYIKEKVNQWLSYKKVVINEKTKPLALLMTVTNLQGLLKKTETTANKDKSINTVTHGETRLFLFHSGLKDKKEQVQQMWKKVLISGRASGAFPLAFPPVGDVSTLDSYNLRKCVEDYGDLDKQKDILKEICIPNNDASKSQFLFSYTDGGVLDGLPINKGISLIKDLLSESTNQNDSNDKFVQEFKEFQNVWNQDKDIEVYERRKQDSQSRRYIYIQPIPINQLKPNTSLVTRFFSMFEVGFKGLTLPRQEHDAIRLQDVEDINKIVEDREKFFDEYKQQPNNDFEKYIVEAISSLEKNLLKVIPYLKVRLDRIDPTIILNLATAKNIQLVDAYKLLTDSNKYPRISQAFTRQNPSQVLASDFFGAFGGFFDMSYRQHDFLLGRLSGWAWLIENVQDIELDIPDNLTEQIQQTISDQEPQLKVSQWLRVLRMFLRTFRILLSEIPLRDKKSSNQQNQNFLIIILLILWKTVFTLFRFIMIILLSILELVLTFIFMSLESLKL